MVDEVATGKVTINVNRGSTSGKGKISTNEKIDTKNLKSAAESLKDLKDISKKTSKLSMAGLLGAGGMSATVLTALAAAAAVAVSALSGETLSMEVGRAGGSNGTEGYYQDALIDGERRILEVNEQTGEVVDVLTEREAMEKGILDETGKIYENYRAFKGEWRKITDGLTTHGNTLDLSSTELEGLLAAQEKSRLLQEEYNRLQRIVNANKAKEAQTTSEAYLSSTGTRYTFSGSPVSEDRPINYMDIVWQNQINEQQAKVDAQQVSYLDDIWPGAR